MKMKRTEGRQRESQKSQNRRGTTTSSREESRPGALPRGRSLTLLAFLGFLALGAGAFPLLAQTPRSLNRAAQVHVSVLSVAPWDDAFKESLQPTFDLDEEGAMKQAVATTRQMETRFADHLQRALSFSPQQRELIASKSFSRDKDGETSSSSESTTHRRSATREDLPEADLGEAPDPSTGEPRELGDVSVDPMTRYWAASALYQEVQLLNRYVKDAVGADRFEPYVVRLQVSTMPYSRNTPFDAFTNLSFFPAEGAFGGGPRGPLEKSQNGSSESNGGECSDSSTSTEVPSFFTHLARNKEIGLLTGTTTSRQSTSPLVTAYRQFKKGYMQKPCEREVGGRDSNRYGGGPTAGADHGGSAPLVVPLLVTDNLEATLHGRSTDRLRQLAMSVLLLRENLGGSVDITRARRNVEALFGRDMNSLLTVGKLSNNTLTVRLGAMQQVDKEYALLPRTHNITLLLLLPKPKIPAQVSVVSRTTLRNVHSGKPLPPRSRWDFLKRVGRILEGFGIRNDRNHRAYLVQRLYPLVQKNAWKSFGLELDTLEPNGPSRGPSTAQWSYRPWVPREINSLRHRKELLWSELAGLLEGSEVSTTQFPLPPDGPTPTLPPINQTVLVRDNEKEATLVVRDGSELGSRPIDSELIIKNDEPKKTMNLRALRTKVSTSGRKIELVYPSPKALDFDFQWIDTTATLRLWFDNECREYVKLRQVQSKTPKPDESDESPSYSIVAGVNVLRVSSEKPSSATLRIFQISPKQANYKELKLWVDGARATEKHYWKSNCNVVPVVSEGERVSCRDLRLHDLEDRVRILPHIDGKRFKPLVIRVLRVAPNRDS